MKSKINLKGHPLHPILVSFPIVCFIGTFVFDALGIIYGEGEFHNSAFYLSVGGAGFAVLAAIPGFVDYLLTVPPDSSAKKRAARHGIINVTVLVIFLTGVFLKSDRQVSFVFIVMLEGIGVVLLGIAGWMGGTLVYRNQIGVDIRYAHAGKWREEYKAVSSSPVEITTTQELKENQMKLIRLGDKRIVVCNTGNGFAAFDDHCTHRGGSLAGGVLICGIVQCPWHGSQFDVHSGEVKAGPAGERIETYPVTESGGKILIGLKH
jgi:uncharacterized membrane protein/nitrite reductase/ring-hydroxylating ferredoxin subunit